MRYIIWTLVIGGGTLGLLFAWAMIDVLFFEEARSRRYYQNHPEAGMRLLAGIKLAFSIPNWNDLGRQEQEALIGAEVQVGSVEGCPTMWSKNPPVPEERT